MQAFLAYFLKPVEKSAPPPKDIHSPFNKVAELRSPFRLKSSSPRPPLHLRLKTFG